MAVFACCRFAFRLMRLCRIVGAFAKPSKPIAAERSGRWMYQVERPIQSPPGKFLLA